MEDTNQALNLGYSSKIGQVFAIHVHQQRGVFNLEAQDIQPVFKPFQMRDLFENQEVACRASLFA
jgi:hypothetical protein